MNYSKLGRARVCVGTTYIMLISDMDFKVELFILWYVYLEHQELVDDVEAGSHTGFFARHRRLRPSIMKISIISRVRWIGRQLDSVTR